MVRGLSSERARPCTGTLSASLLRGHLHLLLRPGRPDQRSRDCPAGNACAPEGDDNNIRREGGSDAVLRPHARRAHRAALKKSNHLLHFFIGLFTCGLWWLVWPFIAIQVHLENRDYLKWYAQARYKIGRAHV